MATQVDFDYDGPPVTVSNGMAVQLVAQFGPRNAWFAFLKLRGMQLVNNEAEKSTISFGYFCNKIGYLRLLTNEFNGKKEATETEINEFDSLMEENFDNFLASPNSLELRKDAIKYDEVNEKELTNDDFGEISGVAFGQTPTRASLLEVIQQSNKKQIRKQHSRKNTTTEMVANEEKEKSSAPANKQIKEMPVKKSESEAKNPNKLKRAEKEDDPGTKQVVEKLLAAKEEIARRHAETIDDVVSLVMEKIKNNQPFEGELAVGSTGAPPKSHHKRTGGGIAGQKGGQRGGGGHRKAATEEKHGREILPLAQQTHHQFPIQTSQGPITMPTNMMAATPANTFTNIPPGQSIVLLHNPATGTVQQLPYSVTSSGATAHQQQSIAPTLHAQQIASSDHQVTILGNFPSEIMHRPVGGGQQHSSKRTATSSAHHPTIYQPPHQQQQQFIGQLLDTNEGTNNEGSGSGAGITPPIELTIQQNMTVQELIQTLKAQSRHQNAQIILHHNANPPPTQSTANRQVDHHFYQQETPDSSSQEAIIQERHNATNKQTSEQKGNITSSPKKGRKRRANDEDFGSSKKKQLAETKQQQQPTTFVTATEVGKGDMENTQKKEQPALKTAAGEMTKSTDVTIGKKQKQQKGKKDALKIKQQEPPQKSPEQQKDKNSLTTTTSTPLKSISDDQTNMQQQLQEVESQLRKANKQLAAEKNKWTSQKKRADKLQGELDKALDSIQLLQIDLACQKTDNNNLIGENIALKSENQQLRSKNQKTSSSTVTGPYASSTQVIVASSAPNGRGRKKKAAIITEPEENVITKTPKSGKIRTTPLAINLPQDSSRNTQQEKTPPPYTLSSELGRRQSKRICVARNQFVKNLF